MSIKKLMKLGLFAVVILFLVGDMVSADIAMSARLGMAIPHRTYDPGISANVGLEYYLNPWITLEGVLGYHRLMGKAAANLHVWQMSLNGRIYFITGGSLKPYVNGGFGLYLQKPSNWSGHDQIGFNLGAGLDYQIKPSVALEFAYNYHDAYPAKRGVEFSTLQVGLRWKF
ncbi:MAG: porin family protein [Candidatus Omnitrophota bacterium]